jgi:putative PIN family toxin of toxin-antitoxin system
MKRVVLDTNVVLSGFLWAGSPSAILEMARRKTISILSSVALLTEFNGVLSRAKFSARLTAIGRTAELIVNEYRALIELVIPRLSLP